MKPSWRSAQVGEEYSNIHGPVYAIFREPMPEKLLCGHASGNRARTWIERRTSDSSQTLRSLSHRKLEVFFCSVCSTPSTLGQSRRGRGQANLLGCLQESRRCDINSAPRTRPILGHKILLLSMVVQRVAP